MNEEDRYCELRRSYEKEISKMHKEIKELRQQAVANLGIVRQEWFANEIQKRLIRKQSAQAWLNLGRNI